MGDPRRIRKNYANPRMQWNEANLAYEKEIKRDYKPKNKKEIWKMTAFLQNIKDQAKSINSMLGTARRSQALVEQDQLIARVKRFGLIKKEDITLGDLLGLELRDVMERRLQTLVVRKKLARTMSQSRQFITHGHILVAGKKLTSPSYMVPLSDDETIDFVSKSPLHSTTHPERGDVDSSIVIKDSREETKEDSTDVEEDSLPVENSNESQSEDNVEKSEESAEDVKEENDNPKKEVESEKDISDDDAKSDKE